MTEVAIALRQVGHRFDSDPWLFRDLTLEIRRGSITALLGPNGRGKSTLLHLILDLIHAREGQVTVAGKSAFVPSQLSSAFSFAALDMVLMGRVREIGLWSQPTAHDELLALKAMEEFGIAHLAERPFDSLSGGERQLVILARASVAEAEILFLDEPASALDLRHQTAFMKRLDQLRASKGLTVVFTTHDPQHAINFADNALLLMGDGISKFGPVDEVVTAEHLEAMYDVEVQQVWVTSRLGRRIRGILTVPSD